MANRGRKSVNPQGTPPLVINMFFNNANVATIQSALNIAGDIPGLVTAGIHNTSASRVSNHECSCSGEEESSDLTNTMKIDGMIDKINITIANLLEKKLTKNSESADTVMIDGMIDKLNTSITNLTKKQAEKTGQREKTRTGPLSTSSPHPDNGGPSSDYQLRMNVVERERLKNLVLAETPVNPNKQPKKRGRPRKYPIPDASPVIPATSKNALVASELSRRVHIVEDYENQAMVPEQIVCEKSINEGCLVEEIVHPDDFAVYNTFSGDMFVDDCDAFGGRTGDNYEAFSSNANENTLILVQNNDQANIKVTISNADNANCDCSEANVTGINNENGSVLPNGGDCAEANVPGINNESGSVLPNDSSHQRKDECHNSTEDSSPSKEPVQGTLLGRMNRQLQEGRSAKCGKVDSTNHKAAGKKILITPKKRNFTMQPSCPSQLCETILETPLELNEDVRGNDCEHTNNIPQENFESNILSVESSKGNGDDSWKSRALYSEKGVSTDISANVSNENQTLHCETVSHKNGEGSVVCQGDHSGDGLNSRNSIPKNVEGSVVCEGDSLRENTFESEAGIFGVPHGFDQGLEVDVSDNVGRESPKNGESEEISSRESLRHEPENDSQISNSIHSEIYEQNAQQSLSQHQKAGGHENDKRGTERGDGCNQLELPEKDVGVTIVSRKPTSKSLKQTLLTRFGTLSKQIDNSEQENLQAIAAADGHKNNTCNNIPYEGETSSNLLSGLTSALANEPTVNVLENSSATSTMLNKPLKTKAYSNDMRDDQNSGQASGDSDQETSVTNLIRNNKKAPVMQLIDCFSSSNSSSDEEASSLSVSKDNSTAYNKPSKRFPRSDSEESEDEVYPHPTQLESAKSILRRWKSKGNVSREGFEVSGELDLPKSENGWVHDMERAQGSSRVENRSYKMGTNTLKGNMASPSSASKDKPTRYDKHSRQSSRSDSKESEDEVVARPSHLKPVKGNPIRSEPNGMGLREICEFSDQSDLSESEDVGGHAVEATQGSLRVDEQLENHNYKMSATQSTVKSDVPQHGENYNQTSSSSEDENSEDDRRKMTAIVGGENCETGSKDECSENSEDELQKIVAKFLNSKEKTREEEDYAMKLTIKCMRPYFNKSTGSKKEPGLGKLMHKFDQQIDKYLASSEETRHSLDKWMLKRIKEMAPECLTLCFQKYYQLHSEDELTQQKLKKIVAKCVTLTIKKFSSQVENSANQQPVQPEMVKNNVTQHGKKCNESPIRATSSEDKLQQERIRKARVKAVVDVSSKGENVMSQQNMEEDEEVRQQPTRRQMEKVNVTSSEGEYSDNELIQQPIRSPEDKCSGDELSQQPFRKEVAKTMSESSDDSDSSESEGVTSKKNMDEEEEEVTQQPTRRRMDKDIVTSSGDECSDNELSQQPVRKEILETVRQSVHSKRNVAVSLNSGCGEITLIASKVGESSSGGESNQSAIGLETEGLAHKTADSDNSSYESCSEDNQNTLKTFHFESDSSNSDISDESVGGPLMVRPKEKTAMVDTIKSSSSSGDSSDLEENDGSNVVNTMPNNQESDSSLSSSSQKMEESEIVAATNGHLNTVPLGNKVNTSVTGNKELLNSEQRKCESRKKKLTKKRKKTRDYSSSSDDDEPITKGTLLTTPISLPILPKAEKCSSDDSEASVKDVELSFTTVPEMFNDLNKESNLDVPLVDNEEPYLVEIEKISNHDDDTDEEKINVIEASSQDLNVSCLYFSQTQTQALEDSEEMDMKPLVVLDSDSGINEDSSNSSLRDCSHRAKLNSRWVADEEIAQFADTEAEVSSFSNRRCNKSKTDAVLEAAGKRKKQIKALESSESCARHPLEKKRKRKKQKKLEESNVNNEQEVCPVAVHGVPPLEYEENLVESGEIKKKSKPKRVRGKLDNNQASEDIRSVAVNEMHPVESERKNNKKQYRNRYRPRCQISEETSAVVTEKNYKNTLKRKRKNLVPASSNTNAESDETPSPKKQKQDETLAATSKDQTQGSLKVPKLSHKFLMTLSPVKESSGVGCSVKLPTKKLPKKKKNKKMFANESGFIPLETGSPTKVGAVVIDCAEARAAKMAGSNKFFKRDKLSDSVERECVRSRDVKILKKKAMMKSRAS